MLAHVTNLASSPRGFDTGDSIALLEPGETLLLDLAEHPAHRAWEALGEVTIAPVPEKEAKAMRKRLDARVEAEAQMQSEALARLPAAGRADSPMGMGEEFAPDMIRGVAIRGVAAKP